MVAFCPLSHVIIRHHQPFLISLPHHFSVYQCNISGCYFIIRSFVFTIDKFLLETRTCELLVYFEVCTCCCCKLHRGRAVPSPHESHLMQVRTRSVLGCLGSEQCLGGAGEFHKYARMQRINTSMGSPCDHRLCLCRTLWETSRASQKQAAQCCGSSGGAWPNVTPVVVVTSLLF